MKIRTILYLSTALFLGSIFTQCLDVDGGIDPLAGGFYSSEDYALGNTVFYDIFRQLYEESQKQPGFRSPICPIVTATNMGGYPDTLTLTYGWQCPGIDGRLRSGRISGDFYRTLSDSGAIVNMRINNYYLNTLKIAGVMRLENHGLNLDGNLVYMYSVSVGTVTDSLGTSFSYNVNGEMEQIGGAATTFANDGITGILDDVFSITHTGGGVNRNREAFAVETTNPLIIDMDCKNILSGTSQVTVSFYPVRTIEYGTGTCDNIAVSTVGAYTQEIELK